MKQDYTLVCLSEALSPITHMSGTSGNEAIVAREHVVTGRGMVAVPYISGNAIRHACVRRPGFTWLIDTYGLNGTLSRPVLNFLLHGGSLTESGGREDLTKVVRWQELFPLGRLLGGSLPDQILAGSLDVWRGTLVCEENRDYIARILTPDVLPERLSPAESFITRYQYTRGDVVNSEEGVKASGPTSSNLMIFSGQAVARGSLFLHGFSLNRASRVELGALLWSLRCWSAAGPTLGGQSARGHGRFALRLVGSSDDQQLYEDAVNEYIAYAMSVRDEAVAWLEQTFAGTLANLAKPAKSTKVKRSNSTPLVPDADPNESSPSGDDD